MKRHLFIAAIFLLAGAVVNVAVAWGCAAWSTAVDRSHPPVTEEFSQLLTRIPTDEAGEMWVPHDEVGWEARRRTQYSGLGVRREYNWARRRTVRGEVSRDRRDDMAVWRFRAGFPMLSLHGDSANVQGIKWWRRGVWFKEKRSRVSGQRAFPYAIPFYPIWPGFAVDTLFYAVVVALLCLVVRTGYVVVFRYLTRSRRGLCPKCAYPMGESAVCSECGKTLPTSRASRRIIV